MTNCCLANVGLSVKEHEVEADEAVLNGDAFFTDSFVFTKGSGDDADGMDCVDCD